MSKSWVINASPIILLGKADLLKTISSLAEKWIIPDGVLNEVLAKRPIEPYLTALASDSEVVRETVSNIHPLIAAWDLGQGKSSFDIGLAKPSHGSCVRRFAGAQVH